MQRYLSTHSSNIDIAKITAKQEGDRKLFHYLLRFSRCDFQSKWFNDRGKQGCR